MGDNTMKKIIMFAVLLLSMMLLVTGASTLIKRENNIVLSQTSVDFLNANSDGSSVDNQINALLEEKATRKEIIDLNIKLKNLLIMCNANKDIKKLCVNALENILK